MHFSRLILPILLLAGLTTGCGSGVDVLPTAKAIDIAGGNSFACALTDAGSLRCWGWGGDTDTASYAFMGDASDYRVTAPVEVGNFVGATDIDIYYQHICVVTASKEVVCWGYNSYGQVGNGTEQHTRGPGSPVPGLSDVKKVATGLEHTCALTESGTVKCWGYNGSDRLLGFESMGSMVGSTTPVDVPFITGATDIFAAQTGTCAIVGGAPQCWGNIKTAGPQDMLPYAVPLTNVTGMALGQSNTCAIDGGAAKCWGVTDDALIGNGTDTGDPEVTVPTNVTGLDSGVTSLSGRFVVQNGQVKGWSVGILGDGKEYLLDNPAKTPVTAQVISNAAQVVIAGEFNCARGTTGSVWCWGDNLHGGVGIGVDAEASSEGNYYLTPQKVLSFP